MPTTWLQLVNPAFIILLAPVFGAIWIWLARVADRVFGDRVTAAVINHSVGTIVEVIKRPMTIAIMEEVTAVLRTGPAADADPWGGQTLEWTTASPPPSAPRPLRLSRSAQRSTITASLDSKKLHSASTAEASSGSMCRALPSPPETVRKALEAGLQQIFDDALERPHAARILHGIEERLSDLRRSLGETRGRKPRG